MRRILNLFATIVVFATVASTAQASFLIANSGVLYTGGGGPGTGRAQGFTVQDTFSISSVGIFGDLVLQSFDVVIYDSTTGHAPGSVLASASATVGGTGSGWNDIAINFTFNAGSAYVVNWRPSSSNSSWGSPQYYYDSALPTVVGPLTLVEGFEGFDATSSGNALHPNLRYQIGGDESVPVPGALVLLGLGLAGFGAVRRRLDVARK